MQGRMRWMRNTSRSRNDSYRQLMCLITACGSHVLIFKSFKFAPIHGELYKYGARRRTILYVLYVRRYVQYRLSMY